MPAGVMHRFEQHHDVQIAIDEFPLKKPSTHTYTIIQQQRLAVGPKNGGNSCSVPCPPPLLLRPLPTPVAADTAAAGAVAAAVGAAV